MNHIIIYLLTILLGCLHAEIASSLPASDTKLDTKVDPSKLSVRLTIYSSGGGILKQSHRIPAGSADDKKKHKILNVPSSLVLDSVLLILQGDQKTDEFIQEYDFQTESEGHPGKLVYAFKNNHSDVERSLDIIYAFKNLKWNAFYTLLVSSDFQNIILNGYVIVENKTDVDLHVKECQLVDGHLPTEQKTSSGTVGSVRAYTYSHPIDIKRGHEKRLNWVSHVGLNATPEIRIALDASYLGDLEGKILHPTPQLYLSFNNTKESGLGYGMPTGETTLYYQDTNGHVECLGKTRLTALVDGQNFSVRIPQTLSDKGGDEFVNMREVAHIETDFEQTEFKKLSDDIVEVSGKMIVRNRKNAIQTMRVTLDIPPCASWEIIKENFAHQRYGDQQAQWTITAAGNAETDLKFRIRINGLKKTA